MKSMQYKPIKVNPDWAEALGWMIVAFPSIFVPVWFINFTCTNGVGRLCCYLNSPRHNWGPAQEEYRTGRYSHMEDAIQPNYKEPNKNEPIEKDATIINGYNNVAYNQDEKVYQNGEAFEYPENTMKF